VRKQEIEAERRRENEREVQTWVIDAAQNTMQHTEKHRNTLQHTSTQCNTPVVKGVIDAAQNSHNATRCNALQHTAAHCNTLQHTATHCNTLQWTYRQRLH